MNKQREKFRKYESKFDRKAKMAERKQFRETLDRARLNTDTDYMGRDDSRDYADWYEENHN
jgi:hypothetical protein